MKKMIHILMLQLMVLSFVACKSSTKAELEAGKLEDDGNKSTSLEEGFWSLEEVACDGDPDAPIFPDIGDEFDADFLVNKDGAKYMATWLFLRTMTELSAMLFINIQILKM